MRILILVFWLLLPVGALAFHLGPGQNHLRLDQASETLLVADQLVQDEKWSEALECYDDALSLLPDEQIATRQRVLLERAKVQMNNRQLSEARKDLQSLVDTLLEDQETDPELLSDARSALASSQYYMTWLMRLEGLPRDKWEPEITASQQTYRLLAKQADEVNEQEVFVRRSEDLESAVRLARMDLGELQGLPLPNQ